jgi:hypothetical protein
VVQFFFRRLWLFNWSINSLPFMKADGSLVFSQKFAGTDHSPESYEYCPYFSTSVYNRPHLSTPVHMCPRLLTSVHTCPHLTTPVHMCPCLFTALHTCPYLYTPNHTSAAFYLMIQRNIFTLKLKSQSTFLPYVFPKKSNRTHTYHLCHPYIISRSSSIIP